MAATQQENISLTFARLVTAANALHARIGLLSNLTTVDKSSIVAALNEIRGLVADAGAKIDDAVTATSATWSSSKIQTKINDAMIALIGGASGAEDSLKELADKILALAQADAGLVSAVAEQTFTAAQKKQACLNIGIDPEYDYLTAVNSTLAEGL